MAILKWLISGLAGGTIAAVLWVLAAMQWEAIFGYAAIGVGVLAGITVRLSSRYDQTPPTRTQSVIAGICTVLVALTAFWMIASIRADQLLKAQLENQKIQGANLSLDQLPVLMARDEAFEATESGQTLQWPEGQSLQTAQSLEEFPEEIAQKVQDRHEAMTSKERETAIAQRQEMIDQLGEQFLSQIRTAMSAPEIAQQLRDELLWKQLLPKNFLWIFLGCMAAFWLSSESRVSTSPPATAADQPSPHTISPASPTSADHQSSGEPRSDGEDASLP